jgi:thiamine transport system ATP-binding protein
MLVLEKVIYAHPGQSPPYSFSMHAAAGEITAVTGPSGSGKSTLLDLIAGFLVPASGSIRLGAQDLVPLEPEDRPVSILFQSESLFEHLSAARNIALGLPSQARNVAARVAAALDEVGLSGFGPRRAETLSGGEKQRVSLARTLLRNRPVLLLDEPFSALDDATRVATRGLVGELTRRHDWITLLVSHHADDIAALAARSYRINDGGLVAD